MASNRRSTREVKPKKDNNFIYDDIKVLEALTGKKPWQLQLKSQAASKRSDSSRVNKKVKFINANKIVNLNDIEISLVNSPIEIIKENKINYIDSSSLTTVEGPRQSFQPNDYLASAAAAEVNKPVQARLRRISSTDFDYLRPLDDEGNVFLSAASCSGMSGSEDESTSSKKVNNPMSGNGESSKSPAMPGDRMSELFVQAIDKMETLTNKVVDLTEKVVGFEDILVIFHERLAECEDSYRGTDRKSSKGKDVKKSKLGRVEFEKGRYHKVVQDTLKARKKKTDTESEDPLDEEDGLKDMMKAMSKKGIEASERKLKSRLDEAGHSFPEETDSDNQGESETDNSGSDDNSGKSHKTKVKSVDTESSDDDRSSRHSRKVKSGAKVKRRPVVRTELWPHTICNEDDGEETTCDDISLAKFLSCYTYIMITCERRKEVIGRPYLLHAMCSILECLPWSEARSFHNVVMVKLEQNRIDWKADFSALAKDFIDKKVRQSLRPKTTSSTPSRRSGFRSVGKGYGSFYPNNYYYNNSRSSQTCRLWNEGPCSFGERCRFRHACSSCTEAGKPGEPHKSSSQSCPSARRGRSEQRRGQQQQQ